MPCVEQNLRFLQDLAYKGDHEKHLDEVLDRLDVEQCSEEEAQALTNLVTFEEENTDFAGQYEWSGEAEAWMDGEPEAWLDLNIIHYLNLINMSEMNLDMCAFEDEQRCHELFASNHFDSRVQGCPLNKRSEASLQGIITEKGEDYATVSTDVGKVYVPNHLFTGYDHGGAHYSMEKGDSVQVFSQFKGYQSARQTAMPWRAKGITSVLNDDC
jgi:hypothetical protein